MTLMRPIHLSFSHELQELNAGFQFLSKHVGLDECMKIQPHPSTQGQFHRSPRVREGDQCLGAPPGRLAHFFFFNECLVIFQERSFLLSKARIVAT